MNSEQTRDSLESDLSRPEQSTEHLESAGQWRHRIGLVQDLDEALDGPAEEALLKAVDEMIATELNHCDEGSR
jgi:hypothetical protein